jgi:5'-nucleotidase / UDP-sugar diphosphatase
MKFITAIVLFTLLQMTMSGQTGKKIIILHTNDLHSRFLGYAPESSYTPLTQEDDHTSGGFARIAGIILAEKKNNAGETLVLDAGDFTMGTLFTSLEEKTGFQLRLMKEMGYDAIGLGNHEFDYGPQWLASVIRTSGMKGLIPPVIAGNIEFDKKDKRADGIEELLAGNTIRKKLILVRNGVKIGIFSILGKDAASVAPNAAPVKFTNQISYASKMVKELRDDSCQIVICLSHSGVGNDSNGKPSGEDIDLAEHVSGIDLIVGGHTHSLINDPLRINGTIIVQAGEFGKNVGRLELEYAGGKIRIADYRIIPVDDKIAGDGNVNQLIEEQKARINAEILTPLGLDYESPVAESAVLIRGNNTNDLINSNLGPLIADAIHYYVNSHSAKGTDISIVAAGMIFDNISPGTQTAPDIFRVVPLGSGKDSIPGYALSRLYVTGRELKSILEILLVVHKSSSANYCYYSGLKIYYNPDKGMLRKIKKIEIIRSNGSAHNVDFAKKNKTLYSITADSYMLGFIGIIKKTSLGFLNVVPKDESGNKVIDLKTAIIDFNEQKDGVQEGKEWLALIEFLRSMKDTNGNGIPDIDRKYDLPVSCFIVEKK